MDRFIGGVMGLVFGGIGITVLIFMWSQPTGGFGSPPLFFRVFASFIAIAFVTVGFGSAAKALSGSPISHRSSHTNTTAHSPAHQPRTPTRWDCPNCGSPLAEDNEISPSGDVKCLHCESWYNVNR